jgi:hypothetical protein
VKTTIEIPDPLFREAKAVAAARGESLRELVSSALRRHLAAPAGGGPEAEGWRRVFGKARPADVARVDAVVAADLERVDPADWR